MPDEDAAKVAFAALGALVEGNPDRASDLTALLGMDSDGPRMYGVLCGIAICGERVLRDTYGERAPHLARGGRWSVDEIHPGAFAEKPEQGFSLYFLVARCNQDDTESLRLFRKLRSNGPEAYVRGVGQLLADVATLCIGALAEKDRAKAEGG